MSSLPAPRAVLFLAVFLLALMSGPLLSTRTEASGAAWAAASGQAPTERATEGIGGRLRIGGEPVAGALVTAFRNGQVVGDARSNSDGEWAIPLPGPGGYRAVLDGASLPEGVGLRDPARAELEVQVGRGQRRTLLFPLGEQEGIVATVLPRIAQATVNGIKLGLIIAMTAVGLSLVYGTTRLVNFAHGDMVTFGAVVAFYLNAAGLHLIPAAMAAIGAGGLLGAGLERSLWRPLRERKTGVIQLLVISIGLALLIRHLILLQLGGRPRPYADYTVQTPLSFGPVVITPRDLTVVALCTLVMVAVGSMLRLTRLGKAMRAVADHQDLAEASGIDVPRVILVVWILAGALAAVGGVFLGVVENVDWLMGFRALLLMFAAVILGGLGTAFGAMAGGLIVGLVTEISAIYQPAELKFMWALVALIVILIVRPHGILGRRERIG
jgi:neutral amino acid transport system permease protein